VSACKDAVISVFRKMFNSGPYDKTHSLSLKRAQWFIRKIKSQTRGELIFKFDRAGERTLALCVLIFIYFPLTLPLSHSVSPDMDEKKVLHVAITYFAMKINCQN
jgi:hypothetical protein